MFSGGELLVGLVESDFEDSAIGVGLVDLSGGTGGGELLAQVSAGAFEMVASGIVFGGGKAACGEGGGIEFEGPLFLLLPEGEDGLEGKLERFHGVLAADGEARA